MPRYRLTLLIVSYRSPPNNVKKNERLSGWFSVLVLWNKVLQGHLSALLH
jgi:hypothetical protein